MTNVIDKEKLLVSINAKIKAVTEAVQEIDGNSAFGAGLIRAYENIKTLIKRGDCDK